ncbi:HAD family phosphatase [Candidatus Saccharibacteria bacterium]|nr:MAG: HAD family phosphatase [Candidatus Saccharibacteria bacterium]
MSSKRQPLAIVDIDGTLFRWQLYHELVFKLKEQGYFGEEIAKQLDKSFNQWVSRKASFASYEQFVVDTLVGNLTSIPSHAFDEAAHQVVAESGHKIYVYTHKLIKKLRKDGYYILALSGSQQEVVAPFAARYGFDDCIGSVYERSGDSFTGKIERYVPGSKRTIISDYVKEHDLTLTESVAVGDSDSDIGMLELVTYPIAFNPTVELLHTARQRGWKVVIERKNIAYTLTGAAGDPYVLATADRL